MKVKRNKGYFSISAVSKMFSVHQQTIRLYEKQGLINPKRSDGNTRLFTEEDIDRLEEIIYLTHQLGINLAGVEMIFKLKKQMHKMQRDMNQLFEKNQEQLTQEVEQSKRIVDNASKRLQTLRTVSSERKEASILHQSAEPLAADESEADDAWHIEYVDE